MTTSILKATVFIACPDCEKEWSGSPRKTDIFLKLFHMHMKRSHNKTNVCPLSSHVVDILGGNPKDPIINGLKSRKLDDDFESYLLGQRTTAFEIHPHGLTKFKPGK